jgi:hypothetical protein
LEIHRWPRVDRSAPAAEMKVRQTDINKKDNERRITEGETKKAALFMFRHQNSFTRGFALSDMRKRPADLQLVRRVHLRCRVYQSKCPRRKIFSASAIILLFGANPACSRVAGNICGFHTQLFFAPYIVLSYTFLSE